MMIDPRADQTDPAENASAAADTETPPGAGTEPDPFAVLENLNAENTALKDKVMRTLAEMENVRRRSDKEVADSKVYGIASFAREMLSVADNLRRALASVPADVKGSDAVRSLVEGVELTERDLLSRLARFNVRPIEPEGKKFDPNLHEVMFEVPDETAPAGTVKQVVETGYTIGDRVLRAAKVGVSRGGPKPN